MSPRATPARPRPASCARFASRRRLKTLPPRLPHRPRSRPAPGRNSTADRKADRLTQVAAKTGMSSCPPPGWPLIRYQQETDMTALPLEKARQIIDAAFAKGADLKLKPLGVSVLDA